MSVNATLCAHKGTKRVSEEIVRAEAQPVFTDSWHPYSHGQVLDAIGLAVKDAGFKIERKEYSLSPGALMFGVWEVNRQDEEERFAIGIRNSINKTMAVGLCAGQRVFVCDNMVFSSEFVLFRKHTGMLDEDEIVFMAREAVAQVVPQWDRIRAWHEGLKSTEINVQQTSVLTIAAMRQGLINPKQFDRWNELYYGNGKPSKYTPTLHGWHGATTELMNDIVLYRNSARQARLNDFIDHEVPILLSAEAGKKTFTFEKAEDRAAEAATEAKEERKGAAREVAKEFRTKVQEARREKKAAERAAKAPKIASKRMKADRKAADPAKGEEKPKKGDSKPKAALGISMDGKLVRRTKRVQIRERIAAEAAPAKAKLQKAPKGEMIKTGKAAVKKVQKDEAEDLYFCAGCEGEFLHKDLKKVGDDLLCGKCRAKK